MKRLFSCLILGIFITVSLTIVAFFFNQREFSCVFVWQACLVQRLIHTPDNSIHEATPIDTFAFLFGILLGVPIYACLSYGLIRLDERLVKRIDKNSA